MSRRCWRGLAGFPTRRTGSNLETEETVVAYAVEYPAHGQVRVSNDCASVACSCPPAGWQHLASPRPGSLQGAAESARGQGRRRGHYPHRGYQIQALEKKKLDVEAWGEIDTAHPGYLGSQDTFYVGTLKGVGRVYQQTYIDTYAKVAQAKLYKTKTPITAADMLNDKVLPFYEQHELPVLRILTDRGTEYCGRADRHDYQLFLAINDIDHTKTKVKSPQTNGICERFHKTILQEFYQVTFRKKIYETIEQLQNDLDEWIDHYNNERTHQGKICEGRTPMQTLEEGKAIWREKFVA